MVSLKTVREISPFPDCLDGRPLELDPRARSASEVLVGAPSTLGQQLLLASGFCKVACLQRHDLTKYGALDTKTQTRVL